jgi:hypothetical protein
MKILLPIVLLSLLSACATNRAPSLNMLEKRADYQGLGKLQEALSNVDAPLLVPKRTKPTVTDIWIHPHEMPTGDYFRGAWIRTVTSKAQWEVESKKDISIKK